MKIYVFLIKKQSPEVNNGGNCLSNLSLGFDIKLLNTIEQITMLVQPAKYVLSLCFLLCESVCVCQQHLVYPSQTPFSIVAYVAIYLQNFNMHQQSRTLEHTREYQNIGI